MQRSAAIGMLAVELGLLPADQVSEVMDRFRTEGAGQRFEHWAVAQKVLDVTVARRLREAFLATEYECMNCKALTAVGAMKGDNELTCPSCNNPWFQRVGASRDTALDIRKGDALSSAHLADSHADAAQAQRFGQPPPPMDAPDARPADDDEHTYIDEPASDAAIRRTAAAAGDVLAPGQRIGNWEIIERAARGGMSTVYKARHPELNQFAAIKVLDADYLGSARQRLRFRDEARVCAALDHPNIIDVLDFGEISGHIYIIMQWIDGASLDKVLRKEGPLPISRVVDIGLQACRGLAAAHSAGVVHRDVKPENLMTREGDGRITLTDFGLAKSVNAQTDRTQPGYFVGTPAYMAPEQVNSEPVSPQTDIYSLGATMFHLVTGRKPFRGDKFMKVMHAHVSEPFPSAREFREEVPPSLDHLLTWMCAKQAENRPKDCAEVEAHLRAIEGELKGGPQAVPRSPVPDDDGGRPEVASFIITPSTPEAETEMVTELRAMVSRNQFSDDFGHRAEFVASELVAHAQDKLGAGSSTGSASASQTGEAGVTVRVILRLARDYLKITVEDDGPEFDAEDLLTRMSGASAQDQLASGSRLLQIRELSDHLEIDHNGRRATALLKSKRLRLTSRAPAVTPEAAKADVEIVEVNGNLDSRNQLQFEQMFAQLQDRNVRSIVVDMTGCEYCNSTALGTLVRMADQLAQQNGHFILANMHPKVQSIFKMLGLPSFVEQAPSVTEAISRIKT